jgi:recombination protein RecT
MRSGQYKTIHPSVIYDGQIVKQNSFTGEMEFKEEKLSNTAVGYLLYFKLLNGFEKFFYMTKDEVESHGKRYSQMYKQGKGFWKTDFDAMALKTVIKLGLSKFGVLSVDMQKAIKTDEGVLDVAGEEVVYPDKPLEPVSEAKPASNRLNQAIDVATGEIMPPIAHDNTREAHWKQLFMAAPNVKELNDILKMIPENEQSPDLSECYSAQYKVLAAIKSK